MKVAVLAGGRSSGREVSLSAAEAIRDAMVAAGHTVNVVCVERSGAWRCDGSRLSISPGDGLLGVDVVFPALRGPCGEDGTVQGLLEMLEVPYVGAGVLASSLCVDRAALKDMLAAGGVPQVPYLVVREQWWRRDPGQVHEMVAALRTPLFVRPARLRSSVAIATCDDASGLEEGLERAFAYDGVAVLEECCSGVEVQCGVIGLVEPEASVPGQIVLGAARSNDRRARYGRGGYTLRTPAAISATAAAEVQRLACETFARVGCAGFARVDFVVEGDRVLVNDVSTIPGFASTSDFCQLWQASGVDLPDLCDRLLGFALERFRAQRGVYVV